MTPSDEGTQREARRLREAAAAEYVQRLVAGPPLSPEQRVRLDALLDDPEIDPYRICVTTELGKRLFQERLAEMRRQGHPVEEPHWVIRE